MGKIIILMLIALANANHIETPGEPIFGRSFILDRAARTPSCANKYGPVCADCNTLLTCLGRDPPAQRQNCASAYPGRPYCVNNRCSNVPDANAECSAGITCTGQGYFPNPNDCTQYYICSGPAGTSQLYQCAQNFVYDSKTYQCKRRFWASDCPRVNCASNPNRYVAYPGNPAYYTYCMNNNSVSTPIIFKCPDTTNYEYSQATERCQLKCRVGGRLPDPEDCEKYYECARVGFSFVSQHQTCVRGTIYNDSLKQCVVGECRTTTTTTTTTTTRRPTTTTRRPTTRRSTTRTTRRPTTTTTRRPTATTRRPTSTTRRPTTTTRRPTSTTRRPTSTTRRLTTTTTRRPTTRTTRRPTSTTTTTRRPNTTTAASTTTRVPTEPFTDPSDVSTVVSTNPTDTFTDPTGISTDPIIVATDTTIVTTNPTVIVTDSTVIVTEPTISSTDSASSSTEPTVDSSTDTTAIATDIAISSTDASVSSTDTPVTPTDQTAIGTDSTVLDTDPTISSTDSAVSLTESTTDSINTTGGFIDSTVTSTERDSDSSDA